MIEISRGDELPAEMQHAIVQVLVSGFAEDFAFFSKEPEILSAAFEHMVIRERFYVALVDGQPAAIASLTISDEECFAPGAREFRRVLGFWHGTISYFIVRSQFLGAADDAHPGLAEIGFVTTAPRHQGQGVATALIQQLIALPYDHFVLRDIKDSNAAALGLYRKLGFQESRRRPVRWAKRAGFASYVSMSLDKTA